MRGKKMAEKNLNIKLRVKGDKKAQGSLNKTENSLKSLGSQALKVGGIFFAARGLIQGLSAVIRLSGEQEKAEAQLNAVLKSTGEIAGLTSNELKNMASSLQEVTTFGDETILKAQSLLLTFTKIGEDVFPQATETVLNMSTAMGTDLQSSVVQLGKALNDPITGISALSRVGVQLTETQKNQIKKFTELGDVASAQKVILAELETQFGGLARATSETMAGSLEQMNNAIGDSAEALGDLLAPVVISIAKAFKTASEVVGSFFKRMTNPAFQPYRNNPRTGIIDNTILSKGNPDDSLVNKTKTGIESITQFLPFGEKSISGALLRGIGSLLPERDYRQNVIEDFYSDPSTRGLMSQIPGMDQYNIVSGGLLNMLTGGKYGDEATYGLSGAIDKRMETIKKTLKKKKSAVLEQRLKDLQALKDREAKALKDARDKAAAELESKRRGRRPGSGGDGPGTKDSGGPTGGFSYDSGGRQGFGYGL